MKTKSKIDSLGLFLPLDMVEIKNLDFYTTVKVNKGTGEELGETTPSMFFDDNGIKTGFKIDTKPWGRSEMVQGLSFPINAKMLGSDYFDGVNTGNIRNIHGYINSLSCDLSISMSNLLKARASDIDFCVDGVPMVKEDFSSFQKQLSKMCQSVGIRNYNPSKDGQFYIQTRPTAREKTPFAKVYQKRPEYVGSEHQKQFFIDSSIIQDYTRAEVTMKNKQHLTTFSKGGIKSSNFLSVLEGNYSNIVQNVFNHYFSKSPQKIKTKVVMDSNKLKGYDAIFYSQFLAEMERLKCKGEINELELIHTIFTNNTYAIPSTNTRILKKRRKQIEHVFNTYFGAENGEHIEDFNNYMKDIGLMN